MEASHRAARTISMFVVAFFMQWWAMLVFGVWELASDEVPQPIFHVVTTFSNIGGVQNLIVYILIRRIQFRKGGILASKKRSWKHETKKPFTHAVTTSDNISLSDITHSREFAHTNKTPKADDSVKEYCSVCLVKCRLTPVLFVQLF